MGTDDTWEDSEMARNIVVMGSGETSPTMVTPHQQIFSAVGSGSHPVVLDTPFGFQENADDLTDRIVEYFAHSVGEQVGVVSLRNTHTTAGETATALSAIRDSRWLFAGPGSPTYALKVWHELGISPHFDAVLEHGTLVFASAAALTVGSFTIPVYEMYKVGEDPHWLPGLNLMERHTGLNAAIVPHFDNNEGANHDTRYCYMGERRLRALEAQLPPETFIVGVDEHTGIRFNLDERVAYVFGKGQMTIRHHGQMWTVSAGNSATFDEIISHTGSAVVEQAPAAQFTVAAKQVEELLDDGQVQEAVNALLSLDDVDRDFETRATVHALVTRLGQIAASPRVDLVEVVGPYIEALLQARQAARSGGRWDEADDIRDRLMSLHVTVKDQGDSSTWEIS